MTDATIFDFTTGDKVIIQSSGQSGIVAGFDLEDDGSPKVKVATRRDGSTIEGYDVYPYAPNHLLLTVPVPGPQPGDLAS